MRDQQAFRNMAETATRDVVVEPQPLLSAVYGRYSRRRARLRVLASGTAAVAALAIGIAVLSPRQTVEAGVQPYTVTADEAAAAITEVAGVEFTYLPPGVPAEPGYREQRPMPAGQEEVMVCFTGGCSGGLGVTVSRALGLDVDGYLETHWIGDATPTTVGGKPALATSVKADDAGGLVWSPEPGVVIEMHIGSGQEAELRKVVEGMRVID